MPRAAPVAAIDATAAGTTVTSLHSSKEPPLLPPAWPDSSTATSSTSAGAAAAPPPGLLLEAALSVPLSLALTGSCARAIAKPRTDDAEGPSEADSLNELAPVAAPRRRPARRVSRRERSVAAAEAVLSLLLVTELSAASPSSDASPPEDAVRPHSHSMRSVLPPCMRDSDGGAAMIGGAVDGGRSTTADAAADAPSDPDENGASEAPK